jgi:hypothetical protein
MTEDESAAAKEKTPLPAVAPEEKDTAAKVDALIVRAERSKDLFTLTVGPVEPSALT